MNVHGRMGDSAYRTAAVAAAHDPLFAPINNLVDDLRNAGRGWVPYVAPTWGGVDAELLLVYRDPGPMTNPDNAGSGFLSAENDDPAARRLAWLLDVTEIPQTRAVSWNAYPWYINRPPKAAELEIGVDPLQRLLGLLPRLRVVVLCGGEAQDVWRRLSRRHAAQAAPYLTVPTYHTGNQAFFVAEPERQARKVRQLYAFAEAARLLGPAC